MVYVSTYVVYKMSLVRILKFSSESSSVAFVRLLHRVFSFSCCCMWYVIIFFSTVITAGREMLCGLVPRNFSDCSSFTGTIVMPL